MRAQWLNGIAVSILLLLWPALGFAGAAEDKAAAEALFDEARRLMSEKNYAAACPKLEASQRMDPGVGTMLNLADCYENVGRTASAWALFREIIVAARRSGSPEREEIARSRAEALNPRLSYLTIAVWEGQDVRVTRDGKAVDSAVLGTPIPVDPGDHVVEASAEGKRSWSTKVKIEPGPSRARVTVPILPDESGGESGTPAASISPGRVEADSSQSGATQRVLALVAGGAGVVGLVAGTIFGLKASSDWDEAKSNCDPYPQCGERGAALADDARSEATISTIAFIVGGVGVAGGAVLWFTAPDDSAPRAGLTVGPTHVGIKGSF